MSLKEKVSFVVQFITDIALKIVYSLIETTALSSMDYMPLLRHVEVDPYRTGGSLRCSSSYRNGSEATLR